MNNFNKLYQTLCEDEIFKASTPEEGIRRKQEYAKMVFKEMIDQGMLSKNEDGTYDANESVFIPMLDLTSFPVRFNVVHGSFVCSFNNLTKYLYRLIS